MAVLHSDAVALVLPVVDAAVAVPVLPRVPHNRAASFVLVRRTGGTARDVVADDVQITVESWAASDAAASDLSQLVRQALHSAAEAGTGQIRRVQEFSGPAFLPDGESTQARYSQTFSVTLRA